jgi:hypothetical protein
VNASRPQNSHYFSLEHVETTMDFLASLGLEELPEQQTRTAHLVEDQPDFQLQLGFDACCVCGKALEESSSSVAAVVVECRACKRVRYCSEACREQDAAGGVVETEAVTADGEQKETAMKETAMGHTSVVCALLTICSDDEAVEGGNDENLDESRRQASMDRIRSEYESYPATLANVLAEGPCYQDVLKRCSQRNRSIRLHVVGASEEAELFDPEFNKSRTAFQDYAEALCVMIESRGFDKIELLFVGPECPAMDLQETIPITSSDKASFGGLLVRTVRGRYTSELLKDNSLSAADIVIFFNPGFTVPEYDWRDTLAAFPMGTPFLSTTNTELEGIADCQYLLDQDKIQSLPVGLADMFGLYSTGDEEDQLAFFSENPFAGSRVRQSGTLANDLYVKNHWILGGVLDSFDPAKADAADDTPSKKIKTTASSNSKAGNPALI